MLLQAVHPVHSIANNPLSIFFSLLISFQLLPHFHPSTQHLTPTLPKLTNRLFNLAPKRLPKLPTIRHRPQNPRPLRRMRIRINTTNRRLLPTLPTPPIRIPHKEQLFLREMLKTRQVLIGCLSTSFLPRRESSTHAARVGYVLA